MDHSNRLYEGEDSPRLKQLIEDELVTGPDPIMRSVLAHHRWRRVNGKIPVVTDTRDLGAHICAGRGKVGRLLPKA